MNNIDFTNFGERMGSEPHGFGYYAHLSIYDFVRPQAVGHRVLDVGCGTGYGSSYLKQSGALEVVALERDEALVNELTRRHPDITVYRCDLDGEIAFGATQAGLDREYGRSGVFFTWAGFDEMDEVTGEGSAELLDDGAIEITFEYHNGDEAILKAQRDTSSTAC